MQAQRGGGVIAPAHSQPGIRIQVVSTTLRLLCPQERPSTHWKSDWVGLGAGLEGHGQSRPFRDEIQSSDRASRSE